MDLILWRHAEAEERREGLDELARELTPKGEKQAARVAAWLDRVLPEGARILCSPALRCEQTVQALGRKYKLRDELAPDHSAEELLAAAQWPGARLPVVIVGHQPAIGDAIARLLAMPQSCAVRKGAVWWLRQRDRDEGQQTIVVAVQPPELA